MPFAPEADMAALSPGNEESVKISQDIELTNSQETPTRDYQNE